MGGHSQRCFRFRETDRSHLCLARLPFAYPTSKNRNHWFAQTTCSVFLIQFGFDRDTSADTAGGEREQQQ